jgi:hypothetical protein
LGFISIQRSLPQLYSPRFITAGSYFKVCCK